MYDVRSLISYLFNRKFLEKCHSKTYVSAVSSAEGARAAVVGPICLAAKPLVSNLKSPCLFIRFSLEYYRADLNYFLALKIVQK